MLSRTPPKLKNDLDSYDTYKWSSTNEKLIRFRPKNICERR